MRLKTKRKGRKGRKCCVLDGQGKKVACFASQRDAQALAAVVKKSRVVVACDAPRARGRR